jgi:protein-S-isoprenylcysteine O-methyltransferase Ste14
MLKNARSIISAVILTLSAAGQIVLSFFLYNKNGNTTITNIGWGILWISAIFGLLPILSFRKWGKVKKGKGYVHTTTLVDRGVYAILRHPQYLAGILMAIALPLISQHWIIAVLGVIAIVIYYIDTYSEEAACIEKFGEAYERYRERVPRFNFIWGLGRLAVRKLRARD